MAHAQSLHALLGETNWIHSLARSLVSDPHLAADLAQDTTVDALSARPDASRPLRAWLATVMRHNLAKLRRGEHNRTAREDAARRAEREPATHEVVERAETHRNVVLAVLALAEPYRSTLLMRFFEQLSYDEIARKTGVTRAAVNSRVTRGLAELRVKLENTYGGDRRALCLALTPLAKLPTGVAATSTLFGLKTMYVAIGTAAATLVAATVSVNVLGGGREPRPLPTPAVAELEPRAPEEVELQLPFGASPGEPARVAVEPQREQEKKRDVRESDENYWRTELSHVQALPASVESIAVNTGSGDVEVLPSPSGRLEVLAKVRAKLGTVKDHELTQVFEDHVTIEEDDGTLVVEDNHRNSRGWSVSFVVSVPGGYPIQANSGSGDVTVRTGQGRIQANTGSGDVRVELPRETVKKVQANSGSGDVVVEVSAIEEELSANTGSGDVTVRVADAASTGDAGLNSGSGDVHLVLPANAVGTFDLETHSGEVELPRSFGIVAERNRGGANKAHGTVGNGGGEFRLRSGSGDLRVTIGNALPVEDDED